MNLTHLMKFQSMWNAFTSRHPKFPLFLNAVASNGIIEGTVIEIQIKRPDGKEFATNLKVAKEDMELFQTLKEMK